MFDAQHIMSDHQRMVGERSNFDTQWGEVADLILPRQAEFNSQNSTAGAERTNQIFDPYGTQALDDGKSVFTSYVMPQGFQRMVAAEPELMKSKTVATWFEAKTNRLNFYRNEYRSGFSDQCGESAASLLAFGNQGMSVDLRWDHRTRQAVGLKYRTEHIGSVWIDEDWQGTIYRTHRCFELSAEQAFLKWGKKLEAAPTVWKASQDAKAKANKYKFLHRIEPNPSIVEGRADYAGKPFISCYVSISDKTVIDHGGYGSMRLTYSRLNKSPTEKYGRGRGVDILPALKELQAINIDLMVGAEMALMPPLAAHEDMLDQQLIYGARQISYGAINARGEPMVQRLFDVGDAGPAMTIQERLYAIIDKGFFRDMLLGNKDMKSHVTDSQLYERLQEKGVLLQPLARQMDEWFSPMNDAEIECMALLGDFDDMPGEVREAGGEKALIYDNPLTRAQRAEQAGGYFRVANQVLTMGQYAPEAVKEFISLYPLRKVVPGLAEIEAIPASWAATEAELEESDAADAQQLELANLTEVAPVVADVTQKLSQAQGNVA
jgi:hypothetical protein